MDAMVAKFEIYKNKAGEFHWRPTHLNGRIIADTEPGHKIKANAIKNIWGAMANINSR
jgi:uncharacterized protein YegP (UPF0339 family)